MSKRGGRSRKAIMGGAKQAPRYMRQQHQPTAGKGMDRVRPTENPKRRRR